MRITIALLASLVMAPAARAGENWCGYEGGNLHHNASAVDIDLARLAPGQGGVAWDLRFDHPIDCRTTQPGFFGSRNLVMLDGHLAVVAANTIGAKGMEGFDRGKGKDDTYPYISVIRASDGRVVNCISTTIQTGPRRTQMRYPISNFMEAYDTGIGITVLHWDPATRILFARNGGDNPTNNAYLPLANAGSYAGSGWQKGVGAYEDIFARFPKFQDADGNIRGDKEIPGDARRVLDGDQWDYGTLKGKFNNQPNSTAFFEVDNSSGLMGAAIAPAHTQAWGFFLADKFTGQYARRYTKEYAPGKVLFAKWGGLRVGYGHVFFAGPCDDTAGDGFNSSLFKNEAPDQGLRLAAWKVAWEDKQDNGGYDGPGKAESAILTPAWEHEFHSPHKPASCEDAESYLELDAFHRNKTWLIDGEAVWAAWKKSKADPVEVIRADAAEAKTFALPLGQGQRGQDLWAHMSLARVGDARYVVYFGGNALYRKYEGDGKWPAAAEKPLGPAFLCVLNPATSKSWGCVLNTPEAVGPHPTLPANEAEGYFDRTHMVVAGRHAIVGWVEASPLPPGEVGRRPGEGLAAREPPPAPPGRPPPKGEELMTASPPSNCVLHLLSFDVAAAEPPKPAEFTLDLGIPKAGHSRTCLFDLIAADGRLYALITESDTLDSGHHTWTAQRVIAIGPKP